MMKNRHTGDEKPSHRRRPVSRKDLCEKYRINMKDNPDAYQH